MFGPLTAREIMSRSMDPLYPGHVDTNYQQISGGYMNASPAVPTQPYAGVDMHLDPYQNSDAATQEQFMPAQEMQLEQDRQEMEEMAQMADMEEIPYDSGMNESFINHAMDDFFGHDTLENMLDDPDFDMQMRMDFF